MGRPEHLNCVNTAEGIRRINERQELYDKNPEEYERREREQRERLEEEERIRLEDESHYSKKQFEVK